MRYRVTRRLTWIQAVCIWNIDCNWRVRVEIKCPVIILLYIHVKYEDMLPICRFLSFILKYQEFCNLILRVLILSSFEGVELAFFLQNTSKFTATDKHTIFL